jgi:hypothetical protein
MTEFVEDSLKYVSVTSSKMHSFSIPESNNVGETAPVTQTQIKCIVSRNSQSTKEMPRMR